MVLTAVKEEKANSILKAEYGAQPGEALAFCPSCKALQTVWVKDGILMPTRKFIQAGRHVYHDCGSGRPCRLYHSS